MKTRTVRKPKLYTDTLTTTRISQGYSIVELAKLTDLGTTTINNAEQGKNVSPHSAKRIADALGLKVFDLFQIRAVKK